ncbi:MAG: uroporphyrinogen-III synthase [Psychrobacter sp.]|nr:uroporphyrinogen-III synthase [Psychrobacter sp.]
MNNLLTSDLLKQTVINTRPVERAAPLTEYLQEAGFDVISIPMLALQSRAITADDIAIMRAWLAGDYKALVMVSPKAAASGLDLWQTLAEQAKKQGDDDSSINKNIDNSSPLKSLVAPSYLIAVGSATAQVLQQAQLSTASYEVLQPTVANNEGMLAMPEVKQLEAGDKLLVWRGLGGRRLLVDTLQARGVHIDSIAWYERVLPDDALSNYQRWAQDFYRLPKVQDEPLNKRSKPIVIISSGSAFEHWQSVIRQATVAQKNNDVAISETTAIPALADYTYVVLGVRLADMLAELQLDYLRVEDLAPVTITNTIKDNKL